MIFIYNDIDVTALNELYDELSPDLRLAWIPLGILLQIDYSQIQIIGKENNGKLEDCLMAVLDRWLRKGNATLRCLVETLINETMGGRFYELAYRIATKHLNN